MFIYPLDWDLYGEIQFILSTAILLSTLFSMGSHSIVTKYFPYFKKNNTKGLLSISFIYSGLSIILIFVLLFLFRHSFFNALEVIGINAEKIDKHLIVISCLGVMMVFITILRTQSFNFQRIVAPDLISNFSLKVFLPIVILLSYFSVINNDIASWLIALFYVVILITLLLYLHALGGLDFKLSTLKRIKIAKHIEMIRYMMYNAMNHVGNVLVYKIDIVMVGLLLTNTKVGYYSIFLFLSVIIEIPTKAVFHITGPMISNAFENNNMSEIRKLYKSSSINLFVVGTVLFALIWMNIDTFFNIMTNGEDLIMYKYIFVVLAFTKLIDMVTSVNFHIISYSKYFRINTLFMAILAILNIV